MPHVDKRMAATLPPDDPYRDSCGATGRCSTKMIADGYTGRKGKGGFYRLNNRRRQAGQGIDRPQDRQLRARRQAARWTSADAAKGGLQRAGRAPGQGRAIRLAGAVATADLRRVAGAGDRRRHRRGRSGDEDRLQLEARPVRADRPDGRRLVRRAPARREGRPCRRCWRRAGKAGGFYRIENGKLQYLGTDGAYHPIVSAPRACCCSPTSSSPPKPILKNGSASLVGHRRRRRLPRVPQQDERARPRHRSA